MITRALQRLRAQVRAFCQGEAFVCWCGLGWGVFSYAPSEEEPDTPVLWCYLSEKEEWGVVWQEGSLTLSAFHRKRRAQETCAALRALEALA